MGNRGGGGGPQMQNVMPLTPVVKWLVIANVATWLVLQIIIGKFLGWRPDVVFGLVPSQVFENFFLWQIFTYMFLHSVSSPFHLLLNMLMLWWLGSELEQRWGPRFFAIYYLVCGIGGGVIYLVAHTTLFLFNKDLSAWNSPVVGASGAIFGLLLAYGILFGERTLHFMMLFPMKAKYFVMILAAMEVATLVGGAGDGVAIFCHLGGLITGYLFLLLYTRLQQSRWRKQGGSRRSGRGLRLVVNNDEKKNENTDGKGPRYWN
jgi:membrane associated rhomboid family serine protease